MSEAPQVRVVPDMAALADAAAVSIERVVVEAPPDGRACIALAGGSTPRAAYRTLAGRCPPWARAEFFFSDERCVPPDHEASNYAMAHEALLHRIPLREEQVHRVRGELEPERAAVQAEADLRAVVPGDPVPRLDLVVLGMGADGHTASLFPGARELEERDRLMVAVYRPGLEQPWRVSMTLPLINAARRILVLVGGAAKAPVVPRALEGDPALPAGRLRPDGEMSWLVTEDAAAELPAGERPAAGRRRRGEGARAR